MIIKLMIILSIFNIRNYYGIYVSHTTTKDKIKTNIKFQKIKTSQDWRWIEQTKIRMK
jgi:hypothetical protein